MWGESNVSFTLSSRLVLCSFSESINLALKNKQHSVPRNWRAKFFSNSSLHKPNMYKTRWIHVKLFAQTGVTILSTCANFCPANVIRMRGKKIGVVTSGVFLGILNMFHNIPIKFSGSFFFFLIKLFSLIKKGSQCHQALLSLHLGIPINFFKIFRKK